jgi:hypothetical protein
MSHEQPTTAHAVPDEPPTGVPHEPDTRAIDAAPSAYAPVEERDAWLDEPEELPRRPRRRLLGAGGNPLALALLAVLLIACGFIGGVLVEKGESGSTGAGAGSGAAAFASRLRALRGGSTSGSATATTGAPSVSGGFTRPTAGTVAYLAGSTLYVTNSEGNTVKVATSAATDVTKTVKSSVKAIHPGETVTVTGASGANGAVSAESISVGSSGGGLAALFGGAGGSGGSATTGAKSSEPSLFGG